MKKLLLYFIIIMPVTSASHSEDLKVIQKNDAAILYDDGLEKAALSVSQIYPNIRNRLENLFGWEVDFYPTVYLVKEHDHFQRLAGHPLVVGYAVPEEMLVVIDYSKMLSDPFSVNSIMTHELCHLLLHRNINEKNLPRWLDEGVSQWISGGLADIVISDHSSIDRAIVSGSQIPFKYLYQRFPRDNESLVLAYAQSKSLVKYMASEYGTDGIKNLLGSLKSGKNLEGAVNEIFMISFDELEKNWYSAMKKKATWVTVLIGHLYEIVFFFGSISLIIAYVKILIRKRALKDDEEDDNDLPGYS